MVGCKSRGLIRLFAERCSERSLDSRAGLAVKTGGLVKRIPRPFRHFIYIYIVSLTFLFAAIRKKLILSLLFFSLFAASIPLFGALGLRLSVVNATTAVHRLAKCQAGLATAATTSHDPRLRLLLEPWRGFNGGR